MASFPQPVKTSYPPAYTLHETDFSTSQSPSSLLETLPIDLMQKIGPLLEVVELGRLSCVSKSLHTFTTQHMWSHQRSWLDASVASWLSPKQRVKKVFFTVYDRCPEIFVKTFGIKSLFKMKIENEELLLDNPFYFLSLPARLRTIVKTEKIIRRSDFGAFMFLCTFKQENSIVAISTHEIPNALKFYFFHKHPRNIDNIHACNINFHSTDTFNLTPQAEIDIKNFFKSGSLKFPPRFVGDDLRLQLPPEVLAFFHEA